MLLPSPGEEEPSAVLHVGTALGLAVLLTLTLAAAMPHQPDGFLRLAGMVSVELLAGGVLGWLARLLALALPIAGQMISLHVANPTLARALFRVELDTEVRAEHVKAVAEVIAFVWRLKNRTGRL